jgi:hypothetical protein
MGVGKIRNVDFSQPHFVACRSISTPLCSLADFVVLLPFQFPYHTARIYSFVFLIEVTFKPTVIHLHSQISAVQFILSSESLFENFDAHLMPKRQKVEKE